MPDLSGEDASASETSPRDLHLPDLVDLDGPALDAASPDIFVDQGPAADLTVPDAGAAVGTWVTVLPGLFTMGSSPSSNCHHSDETEHQVKLTRAFAIQTTEVTIAQYNAVMGSSEAAPTGCTDQCPVSKVSWHQAAAYCNALSALTGRTACYTCSGSNAATTCTPKLAGKQYYDCPGFRLPTEAEFEYAYRAGTTTEHYAGDLANATVCISCTNAPLLSGIAWYCGNSSNQLRPVGLKLANLYGLHDMAGSVYEWVHDWYKPLPGVLEVDPVGPSTATLRIVRGGAYNSTAQVLRASSRVGSGPFVQSSSQGFRCVRSTP